MLRRIPLIDSCLSLGDLFSAISWPIDKKASENFALALSELTGLRQVYLMNSATSAFYVILKALKRLSNKNEVILPAYTAGSLIVAIQKAGLKPVLCDISLEDFNLDLNSLDKAISDDTLAVLLVHMFGIGINGIYDLRPKIPSDIFLIEDCAQAMGTMMRDKMAGSFCDVSFFSFGRGKNLSTNGGGFLSTSSESLALGIEEIYRTEVQGYNRMDNFFESLKGLLFIIATKPWVYNMGYPLLAHFKETAPPRDISVSRNTPFQAKLGMLLLKKSHNLLMDRNHKGMFLSKHLSNIKDIVLPRIPEDMHPVFYRFPVLFKDLRVKNNLEKKLWACGLEASLMYKKPLHHMFSLGYKTDDFPRANYLAEHLLTFPVHSAIKEKELSRMCDMIRSTAEPKR